MKQHLKITMALLLPIHLFGQSPILEKIALYGNYRTKNHTILQELTLKKGKPITENKIKRDRLWLMRLNFLHKSEFLLKPGSTEGKQILLIVIQEKNLWSVTPILGNNDLFGFHYGMHCTLSNIRGRREKINVHLQSGGIEKLLFSWENPWLAGKVHLSTKLQFYHSGFRYLYYDYHENFKLQTTGFNWILGKSIGRNTQIGLGISQEQVWTDELAVNISNQSIDNVQIFETFFQFDSRDGLIYPQKGFFLNSSIERFLLPNQNSYNRINMDYRFYWPISTFHIFAFQTILQISHGTVPIYKRIHMGGGEDIRGYGTGSFVGDNRFFSSIEYRFPIQYLNNPLAGIHMGYGGVFFVDVASAWFQDQKFDLGSLRGAIGFGVHMIWDQWVFRAEYSPQGEGWGYVSTGTSIKF